MLVLGRTKIKYYGLSGVFRNSPYFFTDIRLLKNIRKINWNNAERNISIQYQCGYYWKN